MDQKYFHVAAHYYTKKEDLLAVIELLGRLARATRKEDANISYEFFQDLQNPEHIVILESYSNEAGFDAHRESTHFRQIAVAEIIPRLQNRRIQTFEGVRGA